MPSYDSNPYYNAADHDPPLEVIHAFDAYEPSWDFDIFLVVREISTGKVYVANDSGCSCPTPFEDHVWPTDYTEVRSWEDVKNALDAAFTSDGYRPRKPHDSLRKAVQEAFRG